MKVVEAGHVYELPHVESCGSECITFLRRSSGAVAYDDDDEHPGTNTQEVLRALIDRTKYLYATLPSAETGDALYFLRMALFAYEARAWRRKQQKKNRTGPAHEEGRERYDDVPFDEHEIELRPVGDDGHILLGRSQGVPNYDRLKEILARCEQHDVPYEVDRTAYSLSLAHRADIVDCARLVEELPRLRASFDDCLARSSTSIKRFAALISLRRDVDDDDSNGRACDRICKIAQNNP